MKNDATSKAGDTVTSGLYRPGAVDEVAFEKAIARLTKKYMKARDQKRRDYADWTDEQCRKAAEFYYGCYRHQFRILVPATPRA